MDTLWQDVKYAVRKLAKSPAYTAVALVALALGIGANTAIFSVVDAVLLRPLPYASPDRLAIFWETTPAMDTSVSYPNFVDVRDGTTTFERMGAARRENFALTGEGEAERVSGRMVSADFFSTLGAPVALGRDFTAEDDRPEANAVVVLSYGFWQRRFAGDPGVVGRTLTLDGRPFTVVGVTGETFRYGANVDLYAPLGLWADRFKERGSHPGLIVVGRLKPGVSVDQARADLDAVHAGLAAAYPDSNAGRHSHIEPLFENMVGEVRTSLLVLLGAVGFVLLIACANVANLQLARAATRGREIALRAALGAGRWRLARQLLTESLMLSVAGGALGLLVAVWGTDALVSLVPDGVPRLQDARVDLPVLAFTFAISVLTGVVFGLVPALAASRPDVNDALKEGDRGSTGARHRVRAALVVSEVALALVLLVGAGLMIRSMRGLEHTKLGFEPEGVLTAQLSMTLKPEEAARLTNFVDALEAKLRATPGVETVAVANGVPFVGASENSVYTSPEDMSRPDQVKMTVMYATTPDYLDALRIPLLRGRYFTAADRAGAAPVAVVDEAFVDEYFGGQDPIGKYLYDDGRPPTQIVGVVGHVKHYGVDGDVPVGPQLHVPLAQAPAEAMPFVARSLTLLVRSGGDAAALAAAVRDDVRAVDATQPVFNVQTLDDVVGTSLAGRRFSMTLLGIFAAVALLLAGVGLYGVMAFSTAQRTQEVGIRMALGAARRDVLLMIVRQGMSLAAIGVAAGALAALGLTRLMTSLLYGVSPSDPATFAGVAAVLAAVALLACVVPALRATRVDPIRALRHD